MAGETDNRVALEDNANWQQKYEVLSLLGSGRFGQVHLVRRVSDDQQFAAKQCICRRQSQKKDLQYEIDIMNMLQHPKLVNLHEAFFNKKEVIMIMELVSGGELFERIADETFELTEKLAVSYLQQILEGVAFMHSQDVLHLDLKPENVICLNPIDLDKVKIIDFGFARKYTPGTPLKVMFGTPEFVAPEVVNFDPLGPETDVWAIGVIAYVLLSGLSPFMGDDDAETLSNVTACQWDFDDECFDEISSEAKQFIESLLNNRRQERPSCEECLVNVWLNVKSMNKAGEVVKKLSGAITNMKKFVARRKWLRSINAVRAIGRFQSILKSNGTTDKESTEEK